VALEMIAVGAGVITLVTGPVNSGKTASLLNRFKQSGSGDGFVSIKYYEKGSLCGYRLTRLSTGESVPFVFLAGSQASGAVTGDTIGNYVVLGSAIRHAEQEMARLINQGVQPLYLDEVGRLELRGQGFDAILRQIVGSSLDAVLGVRERSVPGIVERYLTHPAKAFCIDRLNAPAANGGKKQ